MMNPLSILYNRQYRFTDRFLDRSSSLPFKSSFIPLSAFDNLNAAYEYEFATRDESPITAIAFNDENVCLANDVGYIALLDKNFKELTEINAHFSAIFDIKWRPGHTQVLSASGDRSILLWDLHREKWINSFFSAHYGSVKTLSFQSPNVFISGGRDGCIKFFDLRNPCAYNHGPTLVISNPHISTLPSIKSQTKTQKARRNNPIAAAATFNYHPSNVVTSVLFDPSDQNYFYSSGISDNAVKVWDVRRLPQNVHSITANPLRIHTTKNLKSVSNGFSSLIINNSAYGKILYASATNGNIYAFTKNSVHPVIVFSGRFSSCSAKISSFGEDYLLSGAANGSIYVWNCNFKPSFNTEEENVISIENRLPIYNLHMESDQEIPLVAGDINSTCIYSTSSPNHVWKWMFQSVSDDEDNSWPKCTKFITPENYDSTYKISLKRSSPFETLTNYNLDSVKISTIKDWFNSGGKRIKFDNNANITNNTTPTINDENRNISKSTSQKSPKKLKRKVKNSRRSLFETNRKIKEFFPPTN